MDYDASSAAASSVIASLLTLGALYAAVAAMPGLLPLNWLYVLGSALVGPWSTRRAPAYAVGLAAHLSAGIVLSLVFARLFQALSMRAGLACWGVLFATVLWAVAGWMLGLVDCVHPLTRRGDLRTFGPYGRNYGVAMALALLLGAIAFGAIFGGLYEIW